MSIAFKSAIKDVAPGIDPIPPQVLSYTQGLYSKSLQKPLPKAHEIARYHVCAYVAVEKYMNNFNLPQPQFNRIPLPPKVCLKLIDDFKSLISVTPSSSPASSPRKPLKNLTATSESPSRSGKSLTNSPVSQLQNGSPRKRTTTPLKSSPLKKLRALADEESSPSPADDQSPFLTPSKIKPFQVTDNSISIPRLIQLCDTLCIPGFVTVHIIQEFLDERHKYMKKSDWYLACALIYAAYFRINSRIIKDKPNYGEVLVAQFIRQRPRLLKKNLNHSIAMVEDTIKERSWIIEIEQMFMYGMKSGKIQQTENNYRLGKGHETYELLGMMHNSESDILSESQTTYYDTWSSNVLLQL